MNERMSSSNLFSKLAFLRYIISQSSLSIFILLLILFNVQCKTEKQKEKKEEDISYEQIVWNDYNEPMHLLAIKYQIDTSLLKPIIIEYFRIHEPMKYLNLTENSKKQDTTVWNHIVFPKETAITTIDRISDKYNINREELSSFIFDLRLYISSN